MRILKTDSFASGYAAVLNTILADPDFVCSPRGQKCLEVQNLGLEILDPLNNFFFNKIRDTEKLKRYLAAELYWYFSGRRDLEFISKYSKFWNTLSKNGLINSAYGYLIFEERNDKAWGEYEWAYNSLVNDKDTRQAIIRFNKPNMSYSGNVDFPCTLNAIFQIRENKLYLTIFMRSQDEWFGRIYDFPFFSCLLQQMRLHLLEKYPELKLGSITHINSSSHIYEKNVEKIKEMIKEGIKEDKIPEMKKSIISSSGKFLKKEFEEDKEDDFFNWIKLYIN